MSHYYSDIGTIEVDAYINTRRAQVDATQTINSDELASGFDVGPATSNGNFSAIVASDSSSGQALHDIYENRCSKISSLLDSCSD